MANHYQSHSPRHSQSDTSQHAQRSGASSARSSQQSGERDRQERKSKTNCSQKNLGTAEMVISSILGGALATRALRHGSLFGGLIAAALLYRGSTGHCPLYDRLGVAPSDSGEERDEDERSSRSGQSQGNELLN